ncbi:hypothetical protein IFM89_022585 [Coptis chinensis]|uniref:Elongation factor Ts, mitochondrial n=1 Tax=Coptis chinensis TaxID=261450 RepID=A0A835IEU3_9MAGN|nr:hypothetical protein IFM89_022585 [Coptis chinensis]
MMPVLPCSTNNITLVHGATLGSRNNYHLRRSSLLQKSRRQKLSSQWFPKPLSTSIRVLPDYRSSCRLRVHILAATGTDVAVEEPSSTTAGEDADGTSEVPTNAVETIEESTSTEEASTTPGSQSKRPRPARRSDLPTLKNEELLPGATFTGKVKSIQPFGAFVDFGAFTDGLVHVSQLSDSFVKDVKDVVSIGQEVKVRKKAPKSSKFVKGQDVEGTVKNTNRAGAFISLPEGEEGFLPVSEEYNEGFASLTDRSSMEIGQEVSVRVLRITRGQVTLTMKKEEDIEESNSKVIQGVVHVATNPFARAFRENKDIAAFLDQTESMQKSAQASVVTENPEKIEGKISTTESLSETSKLQETSDEGQLSFSSTVDDVVKDDITSPVETDKEVEASGTSLNDAVNDGKASPEEVEIDVEASHTPSDLAPAEPVSADENPEDTVSSSLKSVDAANESIQKEESSESLTPEDSVSTSLTEENTVTDVVKDNAVESISKAEVGADHITPTENVDSAEALESRAEDSVVKDEVKDASPSTVENAIPSPSPDGDTKAEPIPEKNGSVTTSSGQGGNLSSQDTTVKATISPALVKQLREETGAGMMDCKKALAETGGDLVKAQEFLRKKGLASADKKASRVTAEGRIGSYIHDSRIGVLIEVNCETDFVSRGDIFKELVDDLAMQVAACPQVQYLVTEDVAEDKVNKEREIEMQKEDLLSKPEQIRSKIVEGRIRKRLEDLALLEQPYIKNDKLVVKDLVKQTIATVGENIKVKRFVRYNLGEGLEKKSQDFAAEVAAQTATKALPVAQPAAVETKEVDERPPKVTVSASLVKQLREETGAGMMDCKKALAETGGDLEKAQEYLRKKGLSTADKKSSRLAAEGRIGSYIHDSRIGVLIEVNCETDFVGRSEKFKELVDDLAMQVVACPLVQFVSIEDISESTKSKEKELEMQREDLKSKPENIREKIVEGRVSKRLGELVLLEQPFIKDDSLLVKDLVKQTVAAIGENIKVRRFVRFTLGETTEDSEAKTAV